MNFNTIYLTSLNFFYFAITNLLVNIIKKFYSFLLKFFLNKKNTDITFILFTKYFIICFIYVFCIINIIYNINFLKNTFFSILAGSGFLALVIGLTSQEAISNFISGILIMIFKPFKIGDQIKYFDKTTILGIVNEITLVHTKIQSLENKMIIIPNNLINKGIIENANYKNNKLIETYIDFYVDYNIELLENNINFIINKYFKNIIVLKHFGIIKLEKNNYTFRIWISIFNIDNLDIIKSDFLYKLKLFVEKNNIK